MGEIVDRNLDASIGQMPGRSVERVEIVDRVNPEDVAISLRVTHGFEPHQRNVRHERKPAINELCELRQPRDRQSVQHSSDLDARSQTPKPSGWRVVDVQGKDPFVASFLGRKDAWLSAMADYTAKLADVLKDRE
ncbi:MAG: hypothetical protein ACOYM5_13770 [Caulobacter sp.]